MTAPLMTGSKPQPGAAQARDSEARLEIGSKRIAYSVGLGSLAFGIFMVIIGIFRPAPQPFILAAFLIITFVVAMVCRDHSIIKSATRRILLSSSMFMLASIVYAALFAQVAVPVALLVIILSFIVASAGMEGARADNEITIGVVTGVLAALIGTNLSIQQADYPFLLYATIILVVVVFALFFWLAYRGFLVATLRLKILSLALAIVILPLSLLTTINLFSARNTYQEQTNTSLRSSALTVATRLDDFIMNNRDSIQAEAQLPAFSTYAAMDLSTRKNSLAEKQVKIAQDSFLANLNLKERAFLTSFAVLNKDGIVIYSSNPDEVGDIETGYDYFQQPMTNGMVHYSAIEFSGIDQKPYIYFSALLRDSARNLVGVLRIKYDATVFQSLAKEYIGALGSNSQPVVLDEYYLRVAEPVHPELLFHGIAPLTVEQINHMSAINRWPFIAYNEIAESLPDFVSGIDNRVKTPFFLTKISAEESIYSAALVTMTTEPWTVVFVQDRSALTDVLNNQYRLSILIATILAGVISFAATLAARMINNPIQDLTSTALALSSGDLSVQTSIRSRDELGVLGNSFNQMAAQLQQLIAGLEDRVRERTQEMARQNEALRLRSRQLETIADVAQDVVAAQELEALFAKVTRMISERFNFYHVGIFLLDEQAEYAVLRAANSEGGQRMLARQHKLKVGESGIVGHATYTGTPRIATDVGQDAVFFNNPDLPLTRSEMALPLKVGDRVIGALDVQSTESNAFSEEDIQLFTILSDQVAIAIYNSRLYAETAQALSEAQAVHRRYLSQEWSREIEEGAHSGYRYTPQGVVAQQAVELTGETDGSGDGLLTVPVKLRGETIGVIRLQDDASRIRNWTEEEVETVQSVADQVALALENARLFTQTARKADRERRVLEITSKIRSTNDPQAMLQIAVEELQRTLRASRAQVVLQPRVPEPAAVSGDNGNGKNGNGYKHEPVE